jgi:hypothetical protein
VSERHKTHNGRDLDGHFRVRQADVEELLEDPAGAEFVRDDVRLGGAVQDTGPHAGELGERIEQLIADNADDIARATRRGEAPPRQSRNGRANTSRARSRTPDSRKGKGHGGYR